MKRNDLTAGTDYLHDTSNDWKEGRYGRGARVRVLDTGKWRGTGGRWPAAADRPKQEMARFHVDGAILLAPLRRDEATGIGTEVVGVKLNDDGTLPKNAKPAMFSTRALRGPWEESAATVDRNMAARAARESRINDAAAERRARVAAVREALPEDLRAGVDLWANGHGESSDGRVTVRLSTLETLVGLAFGPRDCGECEGNGWVPCEHCEDGTVVRDEPWESDRACTYCEGKGRQECAPCEGEGVRP